MKMSTIAARSVIGHAFRRQFMVYPSALSSNATGIRTINWVSWRQVNTSKSRRLHASIHGKTKKKCFLVPYSTTSTHCGLSSSRCFISSASNLETHKSDSIEHFEHKHDGMIPGRPQDNQASDEEQDSPPYSEPPTWIWHVAITIVVVAVFVLGSRESAEQRERRLEIERAEKKSDQRRNAR